MEGQEVLTLYSVTHFPVNKSDPRRLKWTINKCLINIAHEEQVKFDGGTRSTYVVLGHLNFVPIKIDKNDTTFM